MYKCANCGEIFAEPVKHPRNGLMVCPECGIDDFEQAQECAECGDYFFDYELHGGLCQDCERKALKKIRDATAQLKEEMGETILRYIEDTMEGFIDIA